MTSPCFWGLQLHFYAYKRWAWYCTLMTTPYSRARNASSTLTSFTVTCLLLQPLFTMDSTNDEMYASGSMHLANGPVTTFENDSAGWTWRCMERENWRKRGTTSVTVESSRRQGVSKEMDSRRSCSIWIFLRRESLWRERDSRFGTFFSVCLSDTLVLDVMQQE